MNKTEAIHQLGGSIASAAKAIGVTYQAVNQWPEVLPRRIVDRVEAALWRAHRASKPLRKASVLGQPKEQAHD